MPEGNVWAGTKWESPESAARYFLETCVAQYPEIAAALASLEAASVETDVRYLSNGEALVVFTFIRADGTGGPLVIRTQQVARGGIRGQWRVIGLAPQGHPVFN